MSDTELSQLDCEWVGNGKQCEEPAMWAIRIAPVWEFRGLLTAKNCSALLDKTKRYYLCEEHKFRACRLLMILDRKYLETQIRFAPRFYFDALAVDGDVEFDYEVRVHALVGEATKVITGSKFQ